MGTRLRVGARGWVGTACGPESATRGRALTAGGPVKLSELRGDRKIIDNHTSGSFRVLGPL